MPPPRPAGPCTLTAAGCWIHTVRAGNPALLSGLGASELPLLHIACFCARNLPLCLQFPFQLLFTALPLPIPLALSAILHCMKAITLGFSLAPQDTLFPCSMVVEHGSHPVAKLHLSPACPTMADGPEPLSQLAFPPSQAGPMANQCEPWADALGRVEGAECQGGHQQMLLTPSEAWLLDPSSPTASPCCPQRPPRQERPSSCQPHLLAQGKPLQPCSVPDSHAAACVPKKQEHTWGGDTAALKPTPVSLLQLPSAEESDTRDALAVSTLPFAAGYKSRNVTHSSRQRSSGEQSGRHT